MKRFTFALILMVGLALSLAAQTTSEILGIVTDESGAVVADAKLVAKNIETGLTYSGASGESGQLRRAAEAIGATVVGDDALTLDEIFVSRIQG